ncbi:MAG: adenylate/guanylate cyclase domain-containing protein [Desulfobacterales bacterium]
MNRRRKRDYTTFSGKLPIALAMMGIIPCLLIVYLFMYEKITFTQSLLLFAPLVLFCMLTGFFLVRRSADQLYYLSMETARIQAGEKNEPIRIQADRELNEIAEHFNSLYRRLAEMNRKNQEQAAQLMVYARDLALSYERSKQEQDLRNRLSRYVGNNLVEKLVNLKDGVFLETERRNVTVLFADIRSFTTIAERMAAEEVVEMLNEYFSVLVDIVFENHGLLDKFVGDQLIAVFGLVDTDENAAENAIRSAIKMQSAVKELMKRRRQQGLEYFDVGIGINTGSAIIGNVGSLNRMDYTVIGDCVNVAARLEEMAGGGEIIIGEQTYLANNGDFVFECRGEVYVKNKLEPVICYNVLGREPQA